MKVIILILSVLAMGCAGVTEYEITTPDGVIVKVRNTKDYESYELNATKQADGSFTVQLIEVGVSASSPLKASRELTAALLDRVLGSGQ